jgi:hypothetical protein
MLVQADSRRLQVSAEATNPFHLMRVALRSDRSYAKRRGVPSREARRSTATEILKLLDDRGHARRVFLNTPAQLASPGVLSTARLWDQSEAAIHNPSAGLWQRDISHTSSGRDTKPADLPQVADRWQAIDRVPKYVDAVLLPPLGSC